VAPGAKDALQYVLNLSEEVAKRILVIVAGVVLAVDLYGELSSNRVESAIVVIGQLGPPPNSLLARWVASPWFVGGVGSVSLATIQFTFTSQSAAGVLVGTFRYFGRGLLQPTAVGSIEGTQSGNKVVLHGKTEVGVSIQAFSFNFTGVVQAGTLSGTLTTNGSDRPIQLRKIGS